MASQGAIIETLFSEYMETYEKQDLLIDKIDFFEPDPGKMQHGQNFVWRTVEQHAPIIDGWDLSGQEQEIIEETYPSVLGVPKNDYVKQRADDLRDTVFWERRGRQSAISQAQSLNKAVANAMYQQGSLFYRSSAASGFDFVSLGQTIMNERQGYNSGERCFLFNDRSTNKYAQDLAGRQTVQGRPDETWKTGMIGNNIAQFDIYTGSFLPQVAGGVSPDTTVTGDQSFKPEGGSIDAVTGAGGNVDYREAVISVADSSEYNVGDKIKFTNGADDVLAVGQGDKTNTGEPMTFTIVGKPSGTSIKIFPKPIAFDDPALTVTEKQYAVVDTRILDGAVVERLNVDASARANLFWDKDAVEVLGGSIPAHLMSQFAGKQVISETMKNGQKMYMVYDGQIDDMSFRYRLFTWWGITIKDPRRVGVALSV